jgi:hypothetical protein
VDPLRFRPDSSRRRATRARFGVPEEALLLGAVGNLVPMKGIEYFIQAAALIHGRHPKSWFLISGSASLDHPDYPALLRAEVRRSGVPPERFIWTEGPPDDIYPALDLMLITSLPRSEGTTTTALESMACETPVVATAVGSIPEIVMDGSTGKIVPPADAEAIASAALALAEDPDSVRRLGSEGRGRNRSWPWWCRRGTRPRISAPSSGVPRRRSSRFRSTGTPRSSMTPTTRPRLFSRVWRAVAHHSRSGAGTTRSGVTKIAWVWRQRIGAYISVKPVLRTSQLVPRRSELGDLGAWRRHAAMHRRVRRSGHTILASRHGRDLVRLAEDVERRGVPGDIIDCGVWNGGSTILLASGAPSRDVWAFDSFQGLPKPTESDPNYAHEWVGKVVGSETKLRKGFRDYGLDNPLHVVKGWFDETLPDQADNIDRIALLHIDADWYESVRIVLETLYSKVSPGGWIAVDDYHVWRGAREAVDEFRYEMNIETPLLDHHYWQKPNEDADQPLTAAA